VTSQGGAHARFKRALASGNSTLAWAAAAELPRIDLADALRLCLLVADSPARYARAAARWHARFVAEARGVTLAEAQLVVSALDALREPLTAAVAAEALAHLCERRGLTAVAEVLAGWGE